MSVVRAVFAVLLALVGLTLAPSPAWASGTVTVTVVGHGTVTAEGISCAGPDNTGDCSQFYDDFVEEDCDPERKPPCIEIRENPTVQLTASPGSNGYGFAGWAGCDSVSGNTCTVTVDSSRGVTAQYQDIQVPSVSAPHPGGTVRGTIALASSASDNSGQISRVDFRVRGNLVATDTIAPYTTPLDTSSVADGTALLTAVAYDAAGNSSTGAVNATIDNTPPETTVTSGPADGSSSQSRSATFEFGADGPASFGCRLFRTGTAAPEFGACTGAGSHSVGGLADGSWTFQVRGTDAVGNVESTPAQRVFTVDNAPPDTTVTSDLVNGQFSKTGAVTFQLGSTENGSTFECRFYPNQGMAPSFGPCSGAGTHSVTGQPDGAYVFQARAIDAAGNTDPMPAQRSVTFDSAPPQTLVPSGPQDGSFVKSGDVTFGISSSEGQSSFECRLHPAGVAAPEFGVCNGVATGTLTHSATGLEDGPHVFETRSTDLAGNTDPTPAKRTFTVDTVAPDTTITKTPKAVVKTTKRKVSASFQFVASEQAKGFQCKLDTGAWKACSSPAAYRVAKGKHTFKVRATDLAGNRDGTPATYTWKVRRP